MLPEHFMNSVILTLFSCSIVNTRHFLNPYLFWSTYKSVVKYLPIPYRITIKLHHLGNNTGYIYNANRGRMLWLLCYCSEKKGLQQTSNCHACGCHCMVIKVVIAWSKWRAQHVAEISMICLEVMYIKLYIPFIIYSIWNTWMYLTIVGKHWSRSVPCPWLSLFFHWPLC